jgi:beta-xylosidase
VALLLTCASATHEAIDARRPWPPAHASPAWQPDNGDGTYTNPVIFADYSDPDVVRTGEDYYLVASSFQVAPGLPILHSRDLVNWTIVGHAAPALPDVAFDRPQHGKGLWAPSLRYHAGEYWIYVGDPDRGIFVTKARDPRGPWTPLSLVQAGRGLIDPCPLWDRDGKAYLVHAWAKSRAGFNGVLTVRPLSADGLRTTGEGVAVFGPRDDQPTIEGPKFYTRNGYYYIFAPAGGVATGWQTVLRSRTVSGPYDARIVMEQGRTAINGPHQGAWIEDVDGRSWFVHFQDRGAYGRVVHLQPMQWRDDWPVIGQDQDGDGRGEPVRRHRKPATRAAVPLAVPATSDEFDDPRLRSARPEQHRPSASTPGLQWQWQASPSPDWWSLTARPGHLRLQATAAGAGPAALWDAGQLLLQKFPAQRFTVTATLDGSRLGEGAAGGLVVMGRDYAWVGFRRDDGALRLVQVVARDADEDGTDETLASLPAPARTLQVQARVAPGAHVTFGYRQGTTGPFQPIGAEFVAREGVWIGAKVGLFAVMGAPGGRAPGHLDVDAFMVE